MKYIVCAQLLYVVCLENFWGEVPSPLFMSSIAFLQKSFTMLFHLNDYTVLPPLTLISKFLVVHVSSHYILMNIPNLNHMHVYVVSWVMVLNIKDFVVGIPSLNDYIYLVTLPFGNIVCFLVLLHSMNLSLVLIHSSLILLYWPIPTLDSPPATTPCLLLISELTQSDLIHALRMFHLSLFCNLNLHRFDGLPR